MGVDDAQKPPVIGDDAQARFEQFDQHLWRLRPALGVRPKVGGSWITRSRALGAAELLAVSERAVAEATGLDWFASSLARIIPRVPLSAPT